MFTISRTGIKEDLFSLAGLLRGNILHINEDAAQIVVD
jgi:hypothetical protein